jgi:hypothetical protein
MQPMQPMNIQNFSNKYTNIMLEKYNINVYYNISEENWTPSIYFNDDHILTMTRIQIEDMKSKNDFHEVDYIIDSIITKYIRESRKKKLQRINEIQIKSR